MIVAKVGCVFMSFLLHISGFQVQVNSICALKGSSVDLPCLTKSQTSIMRWFTINWDGYKLDQNELFVDRNHVTFNVSTENKSILTIRDVRDSDENAYCCTEDAEKSRLCWQNRIQLNVQDLQVKVIPTTEGQKATLMCSTRCGLPENSQTYVWFKNREFLYEDSSSWYQQLVSSDKSVTYSCAIKGYEDLRAPEVSVDSVTPTCFSVTYAKGRMCLSKQTPADEPCTITYPRELHIQRTDQGTVVQLTCGTSCPLTGPEAFYSWYRDGYLESPSIWTQGLTVYSSFNKGYTCAAKGHEDLLSAETCVDEENCWRVNYVSRRICVLQGSSVDISSNYSYPDHEQPRYKLWYKLKDSGVETAEKLAEAEGRVEFHDNTKNQHILQLKNLRKNDSAEYRFRLQKDDEQWRKSNLPGVILMVTDLKVIIKPSSMVTEGQTVTLTCSTSCPPTDDSNFIWYLNGQPLTLPENQNKYLVLDNVSIQHAGNYSCAVKAQRDIRSPEKSLTLSLSETGAPETAAGVSAALLIVILVAVVLWIRKKRSSQSQATDTSHNIEQLNPDPVYENSSAPPAEPDDLHYSRVHFSENNLGPLYSSVQPHQSPEQENMQYSTVNFWQNRTQ